MHIYNNHTMPNHLLCFLLFFSFLQLTAAYEEPQYKHCGSTTSFKYTDNSTFATNLNEAFKILNNNTALTNFNSTTYTIDGTAPVTAIALCRGDLTPVGCQPCVEAATAGIVKECPYHSRAEIWYNLCMVRYSEENFLTVPDYTVLMIDYDKREVQEAVYDKKVQELAQNLSVSAGKSQERFAPGWTRVSNTLTLHGYLECSRDLSGENCTNCLLTTKSIIETCCLGKGGGWIATGSCATRFSLDPVYNVSTISAPEISIDELVPPMVLNGSKSRRWRIVVGVTVGGIMGVILVIGALWLRMVKGETKNKNKKRVSSGDDEDSDTDYVQIDSIRNGSFLFDFEMLVIATDNFSPTNWLGRGGFGIVYKGVMASGKEIAVKKLSVGSNQGEEEFSNEVMLLLRMRHRNLVKLIGCCIQEEEKMLVYEYLRNKSLDCFIFDKSKSALLDWSKRFNIIVGIARGLLYLHKDSQYRIIHRDIKASNILLDEHMNPKISDFGLARLFPDEQSQLRTRRIAGTIGYMAPEYAMRGLMSEKSDVFSFGVLILEIISGRKNYDSKLEEEAQELINLTWRLEQEGRAMELVDVTIGSLPRAEALKCIQIGLLCCQKSIQDRPAMSSVVIMLSDDSVTTPSPGIPAYQRSTSNTTPTVINSSSSNSSMKMTMVSAR